MTDAFRLNPEIDVDKLAAAYPEAKRVQIPDLFAAGSAADIAACLEHDVPWAFAWFDGEPRYHRAEALARLTAEEHQRLTRRLYEVAAGGFQYAYNTYPMLDAYLQRWSQVPLLDRLLEFINSPPMLELVRAVTGHDEIVKGDAQATCFGPGHFLKIHDDINEPDRVAAYVLNFTRQWHPDWGGYLQFYDDRLDIEQGLLPRFNVMNIFTVPQQHSVSAVASFAGARRLAVTGWFRRG
jgi:Rps23 Pro-64 3,4-dihydroxylase Tpa1-like proline 4-hydroxylase